ncbi:restriction endonuclease subunit S [Avibacterium volantium]|uniref:restriction endonuclease subunit S n=1 Tax=Avibacterium TaxID=292486 RepID=UPI0039FC5B57
MKNHNIPKLRYPEFTDAWEKWELGKIVNIVGGGTPDTNNATYWNGNIDWYSPTEIGNEIYVSNSLKKISKLGLEKSSAKLLPAHKTILFTSRASIGDMAILLKSSTTNQGFQSFVVDEEKADIYFLYSLGFKIKHFALKNATGSTFLEISKKQLEKMEISIPTLPEQQKIGNLFKQLDRLITLHKRKWDDVILLKKALLQKMFPKNGADFPEIRFPEFTDAWEKCKLGEVAEIYDGTHQTPNYKKSGIMFLSVENIETMISDKFISEDDFKREFKTYPTSGDVLMTRIGDIGTVNIVNTNQRLAYYVSLALLKPKLVLSEYLKPLIESDLIQKELWKRTLHVAFPKKINKGEIEEIPIIHPTLPEQQKIGTFFRRLDRLITLHKRQHEHYQLLKKALLQQMFV